MDLLVLFAESLRAADKDDDTAGLAFILSPNPKLDLDAEVGLPVTIIGGAAGLVPLYRTCLLYTSDAADE